MPASGTLVIELEKLSVATEQLDTALRLYFGRREYFSVITLAGAAEEILGVYLKIHGQPNAFDETLESSLRVYRWLFGVKGSEDSLRKTVNRVKNASKHMMGKKDVSLKCDPREEAKQVLDRAVSNYYCLMKFEEINETPRIRKFNEHLLGRHA